MHVTNSFTGSHQPLQQSVSSSKVMETSKTVHAFFTCAWSDQTETPLTLTLWLEPSHVSYSHNSQRLLVISEPPFSEPKSSSRFPWLCRKDYKHDFTLSWKIRNQKQTEGMCTLLRIWCTETFRCSQPLWGAGTAYEQLGEGCDTTRVTWDSSVRWRQKRAIFPKLAVFSNEVSPVPFASTLLF